MIILGSLESEYVQFVHTIYQPTIPTSRIPVSFFAFFAAASFAAATHHSSE